MAHIHTQLFFTITVQAFAILDFVWFQTTETGFDFQDRSNR